MNLEAILLCLLMTFDSNRTLELIFITLSLRVKVLGLEGSRIQRRRREVKPHQEETKVMNLGIGGEKKEVKVGTCMSAKVRDVLVTLL